MRIVSSEILWEMCGKPIEPYEEVLIEDQSLTQLSMMVKGQVHSKKFLTSHWNCDVSSKKALLLRAGAGGDILFLKPTIEKLIALGEDVTLSCFQRFNWIVDQVEGLKLKEWPVRLSECEKWGLAFNLEFIRSEVKGVHPVDEFASLCGIELDSKERVPKYQPRPEVLQKMQELYPRNKRKRIVACMKSTTAVRDYPIEQYSKLLTMLIKKGYEIGIVGEKGTINVERKDIKSQVINLTESDHTWEEQVAFIRTADCFIGGDSGNTHFAGAMDVPTIALYGSFHWSDRSGIFPSVKSLQGHGDCACCYFHPSYMNDWPKGKPCAKSNKCDVLATIPVERIISEIEDIL